MTGDCVEAFPRIERRMYVLVRVLRLCTGVRLIFRGISPAAGNVPYLLSRFGSGAKPWHARVYPEQYTKYPE